MDSERKYRSYLLRLWMEDANGREVWRFSLEDPFSGKRRGFASLEDLCAYLDAKINEEKLKLEDADEN